MGFVYKITNLVNNKVYIGLTTLTIDKRWKSHVQTAYTPNSKDYNSLFKKAIRKYGPQNFKREIIDEADDVETLKAKEIYWIDYYHSYAFDENSNGYNSTRGGDLVSTMSQRPIIQCDIITGEKIAEYDSIAHGEQALKVRIDNIGIPNHSQGGFCCLYKDQVTGLTAEQLKDHIHSLYPCLVYQLDLKGNIIQIYRNTTEAAAAVNGYHGNIVACCLQQRRTMNNYQWAYQRDIQSRVGKSVEEMSANDVNIVQYKLNGEKIQVWNNMTMASKTLNIQISHICDCCYKKRAQAGGYQWRFAEDECEKLNPITTHRPVICVETNEVFDTPNQAAKHFGYAQATVKKSCEGKVINKPLHFKWYNKEEENNG